MSRSKTRSGSVDIGQKNHYSSVFSRTLSASKLCRGDVIIGAQIDKKPSKVSNLSENRVDRVMSMQQQMGEMEEELRRTKEKFSINEMEKHRVLDQLKEANMRANEALSHNNNKANELKMEVDSLKNLLLVSRDELKTKDKKIDSLEFELGKAKQVEAEKDELKKELRDLKEREKDTTALLYENKKRIQELEGEIERQKSLESKMAATKYELEESKVVIASLHEKIESLEVLLKHNSSREVKSSISKENENFSEEEIIGLKIELQLAQEGERKALLRVNSLLEEMELLKNEWKLAIEAEEKSTKAMEDLALALKEVATEANQAKEKLRITQIELEHVQGESEQLKKIVRFTEERYQNLLHEAKQEAELHKNTADRLRVEAEETLLALNGKEMGFVSCIKKAEEERAITQRKNIKLSESLKAAENMTRAAREETYKLRDILKQAVNEANAAKAAAGIARDENSLLKDCLTEKEEALHFLTKENERLRMSEAAANENVKQLKMFLSTSSTKIEANDEDKENDEESDEEENENNDKNNVNKAFSFNLEDLKFMNEPGNENEKVLDEALKGSIFDANAETPKSEPHTPKPAFSKHRVYSSPSSKSVDFEHSDGSHYDLDTDKNSHRRAKTMFQRVGDLLTIRRSVHRKEPSIEQQTIATHP
ncbi:hypothetical protein DH2020_046251 [Rehmannia glutinosa]|uniref:WEB family protein n=1 Tax=Rehmannia glutinosa TaxID=99300 RepID=A0ABR0UDH2_REHGL